MIFLNSLLTFFQEKIGKTGMVIIGAIVLGYFTAKSLPNIIVTPDTLQQSEQKLNNKMDKATAKSNVEIIEIQLDNLQNQKVLLEDATDVPKPKARHIQRLKEVNKRIDILEKSKKASMDILETK